jgi:hypothetical protein
VSIFRGSQTRGEWIEAGVTTAREAAEGWPTYLKDIGTVCGGFQSSLDLGYAVREPCNYCNCTCIGFGARRLDIPYTEMLCLVAEAY